MLQLINKEKVKKGKKNAEEHFSVSKISKIVIGEICMFKKLNLKPEVVKNLIEISGFSEEEVAKKSKISLKFLKEGKLTIPQLKRLAEVLQRPIVAFFSDEIPPLPSLPDYRLNREKRINQEVFFAQRKLSYLIEKLKELGFKKSLIPSFALNLSPFQLANKFREYLGSGIIKNQKSNTILKKYKELIEDRLKVLVIEHPLQPTKSRGVSDIAGDVCAFSIYSEIAGIVLNETDHPSIKLFSLFHEVCHLLRKNSGICSLEYEVEEMHEEESYCNKFAAEFLVPCYDIKEELKNYSISDKTILEAVSKLSKIYGVSKQVILLRLLHLGELEKEKYFFLRQKLEEKEAKKSSRRNKEEIYKNRIGSLIIKEVKKRLQENKISFYEALNILDVKTKYAEKFLYE